MRGDCTQGRVRATLLTALCGVCAGASGDDEPVILQWFENPWQWVEHRAPDLYQAGYGATWLPPAGRCQDPTSPGYDVFDRFDLGRPGAGTAYGTAETFRAAVQALHDADAQVYLDIIMNHNSSRQTGSGFQAAGGYPGFWMDPEDPPTNKQPTDPWGDFHAGNASGYLQSENPNGSNYDLHRGDLLSLIDIAQELNNQFVRHPVNASDPRNIPGGTVYNRVDPSNARLYPDLSLTPLVVRNPGTSRNPPPPQGYWEFYFYPFNTENPDAGDAISENATALLLRSTQRMMDVYGVDGFRLDAAKHVPSWFWDTYWDSVVHGRARDATGAAVTPFSFVESVEGNSFTLQNYVRKDGFANRDALDLNGAGQLRDVIGGAGLGSWANVLSAHIDNADDGFNNGTLGVLHVFSHDNGSTGTGSSAPPLPTPRQQGLPEMAYMLLRPGTPIVYHNARGITRAGGFFPREGSPNALGLDPASGALDPTLTRLVEIRRMCARGQFFPLNWTDSTNTSMDDVLIFERSTPLDGGGYSANMLVAVNDRYDSGTDQRNVLTTFAPGTRLHELTGNAADAVVDPSGVIPEVLTVNSTGRVVVTTPRNKSGSTEHGRGYVVYAPAAPTGGLELTNIAGTIAADPSNAPFNRRRITPVPVIQSAQFDVRLTTTQSDPLDPNTDDNAVLRFNRGYTDLNGNGSHDIPAGSGPASGYEQFATLREPLYGSGASEGLYWQTIDAARLPEGYNYLSVLAFRHRSPGEAPILREFRRSVYIDRVGPEIALLNPGPIEQTSYEFQVEALDRTAQALHFFWDLPEEVDPVPLVSPFNQGVKRDRFDWRWTETGITHGAHALTVVALEVTGTARVERFDVTASLCRVDYNADGLVNTLDVILFLGDWAADEPGADFNGDGTVNTIDFILFLNEWATGC